MIHEILILAIVMKIKDVFQDRSIDILVTRVIEYCECLGRLYTEEGTHVGLYLF